MGLVSSYVQKGQLVESRVQRSGYRCSIRGGIDERGEESRIWQMGVRILA